MSKTITIRNAVYDELIKIKKNNESFSELLERLAILEDKEQLLTSLRGSITFDGMDKMKKELEKSRWEKRQ
ncbi:MAG: antitoxin VapB family protein [Ferroplasma sp.]